MKRLKSRHGAASAATVLIIGLVLVMLSLAVCGCGSDSTTSVSQQSPESTAASTADATTATTGGEEAPSTGASAGTLTFTDQGGREVTITTPIKSVFCTSPIGTNLMYMLAPDMMVGWNVTPTKLEKKYIPADYLNYVGLGGWYGKNTTGNVEEIIKRNPDVIFDIGTINDSYIDSNDRIEGLLNRPVVMVDGSLTKSGEALRYVGKLIGREERAEELAAYCDKVLEQAQSIAAQLTEDQKVKVYYAEGAKGLNTDPAGSQHTEVLDLVGGKNVAQVELDAAGYGMSPVSLEQVIGWDPDVILVASDPTEESTAYHEITTRSEWSNIAAVKNHRVYQIPRGPFDWFDRPPSISRIIGIVWLGNLLYPDLYQYDLEAEVKSFYKLFCHIDLNTTQYNILTARAGGNPEDYVAAAAFGDQAAGSGEITVQGMVDNPMVITADTLKKMNVVTETLDHPKLGTATYTGVLWSELLPLFKVQAGATHVLLGCTDGYIADLSLADIAISPKTMLCINKNGYQLDAAMPGFYGKAWASDIISMDFRSGEVVSGLEP